MKFAQLFAGRTNVWGTYKLTQINSKGKQDGNGTTHHGTLTNEHYQRHLDGIEMLGVVPNLPDDTCSWFALDIDDYSIDHRKLRAEVARLEIPCVILRSKSGGAHLYGFVSGKISAALARKIVYKWVELLNVKKFDVYPRQDKSDDNDGNWIILPYFGGDASDRYAFGINGEKLTVAQFEQLANASSITVEEAAEFSKTKNKKQKTETKIFDESPPCIEQVYRAGGMTEGSRNIFLSHMTVFYKKVDPDNWEELIIAFNQKFFDPPLSSEEVHTIIRNQKRRQFFYMCSSEPMKSMCKKEECFKRDYGIGQDHEIYGDITIGTMTKIDSRPPIWIVTVQNDDKVWKVNCDTETLLAPRKFRQVVAEECNILLKSISQVKHDKLFGPLMKNSLVVEPAPEEVSIEGQVMNVFYDFCRDNIYRCKTIEDMVKGFPYYEEKERSIYFKVDDLLQRFRQQHRRDILARTIWAILREHQCTNQVIRLDATSTTRCWAYKLRDNEEIWFRTPTHGKF